MANTTLAKKKDDPKVRILIFEGNNSELNVKRYMTEKEKVIRNKPRIKHTQEKNFEC
jgi:hypothetical protein